MAKRRSDVRQKQTAPEDVDQLRLQDADGTEIGNVRIPEIDRAVKKYLEVKAKRAAAKAEWDELVHDALAKRDEAVIAHQKEFGERYVAEVVGQYFALTVTTEDVVNCEKVKKVKE
jgi:hypothetical protein